MRQTGENSIDQDETQAGHRQKTKEADELEDLDYNVAFRLLLSHLRLDRLVCREKSIVDLQCQRCKRG